MFQRIVMQIAKMYKVSEQQSTSLLLQTAHIAYVNSDSYMTYASDAFLRAFHYTDDVISAHCMTDYIVNRTDQQQFMKALATFQRKTYWTQTIPLTFSTGEDCATVYIMRHPQLFETQGICIVMIVKKEETLLLKALEHCLNIDEVTGVYNVYKMRESIQQSIESCEMKFTKFGVLNLTIDEFSNITYCYGKAFSNQLLKEAGRRLVVATKNEELVFHKYEDEFILLVEKGEYMNTLLTNIHRLFREPFVIDHIPISIQASFGVALYPDNGTNEEMLLYIANVAMGKNKKMKEYYAKSMRLVRNAKFN